MLLPLLTALNVVVVGDSHLTAQGYLITTLHDRLTAMGANVHTVGVCGSNAGDWTHATPGTCGGAERTGKAALKKVDAISTRPIKELAAADKANLVIVVMGDTMAGYSKPDFPMAWAWQNVSALTADIAATGATCVWVGPPWGSEGGKYGKTFDRVELMSQFLGNNVAPCVYLDSLRLSKKGEWGTTDGQHLTLPAYKAWGTAIADAIKTLPALAGQLK